ncbi:DUF924 family protein [Piscinibacter sp.]|uniref:DUF924 family protein n=1 Tax=Piscinibacter sp. TaxID=1903157 RepID=UPI002D031515|nr:DUF924 family protein [Albitalea sp.]HUG21026.1 DUF924 family protein [Albitalea sp.]
MNSGTSTPEDILAFWFPDGETPSAQEHERLWNWRLRGGTYDELVVRFAALTDRASAGGLDAWAQSPVGRLALILLLDPFSRAVWASTPRAYAAEPKARALCLQGLTNGHFDALPQVWHRAAFKTPLEQCECDEPAAHLAHLDKATAIADRLAEQAPLELRSWYVQSAGLSRRHRAVIAHFGRYPQRNAILGRASTPKELAFIANGELPPAHLATTANPEGHRRP